MARATPPNEPGAHPPPTALTTSACEQLLAARMLPRPDWPELLGVSCSDLLGGATRPSQDCIEELIDRRRGTFRRFLHRQMSDVFEYR